MAFLSGPSRFLVLRAAMFWTLAVLLASSLPAQTPNVEYRIKAAYLFNFAKFVSWPAENFTSPDAPIIIGILGKDPFGNEIDETVAGKTIERHTLRVKRLNESDR